MGMLDGLLGGLMGGNITAMIKDFIDQQGGVATLAPQFEKNGLGEVFHSWVDSGPNAPITADQVMQAIGPATIHEIAAMIGIPPATITQMLAEHLPTAVDEMTPNGTAAAA